MEKIRLFERKCLRACMGLNRTASSNYEHYVTNEVMYVRENPWVSQTVYLNDGYFEKTLTTGFIPPEAFVYLDRNGLILDFAGDPVINRRVMGKRVEYPPNLTVVVKFDWRYSRAKTLDIKRVEKEKSWYWWLRDTGD